MFGTTHQWTQTATQPKALGVGFGIYAAPDNEPDIK